jgi:hypothetical protein
VKVDEPCGGGFAPPLHGQRGETLVRAIHALPQRFQRKERAEADRKKVAKISSWGILNIFLFGKAFENS